MSWELSDILSLPEAQGESVTQVFMAFGREWPITIDTARASDPEMFFAMSSLLAKKPDGTWAQEVPSIEITTPQGKHVRVEDRVYLTALKLLEEVAVSPKLSAEEWAIFGHKVRGPVMAQITGWVFDHAQLGETIAEVEAAKNGSADGPSLSPILSSASVSSFLESLPEEY
jgi:hypothetical protein